MTEVSSTRWEHGGLASQHQGMLHALKQSVCLCVLLTLAGGCASLPPPVPQPPTHALADQDAAHTKLGQLVAKTAPEPGTSGFKLLVSGQEALDVLVTLADQAERTLDLQYYLIRSDNSSRLIMRHVWQAAERGVHVRLLIDDLNTAGQDEGLMRLTRHPRIEVRIYNPLPAGRSHIASRLLASLTDLQRINHRMHNKMFVADNSLAVTGGRNLGDAYFLRDKDSNFLDIDVLAAGPAVHSLSRTFDRFWNDPLSYPVGIIAGTPPNAPSGPPPSDAEASIAPTPALETTPLAQRATKRAAASTDQDKGAAPPPIDPKAPVLAHELQQGRLPLDWVHSRVLADKPEKVSRAVAPTASAPKPDEVISDDLRRLILGTQHELLLISPYFVPGERGLEILESLRDRGVTVRVLTNSLATTDAPAVHIGYARYRERLLKMGVQLSELKAEWGPPERTLVGSMGSSRASLHAKVMVIDRRVAVVGSMNLDPRSAQLNTEMGVVMNSPAMAAELVKVFNEVQANSYTLSLSSKNELQWQTQPPDPKLEGVSEPGAGHWLKFGLLLLSPFAPDEML